jgi:hypothetical protein
MTLTDVVTHATFTTNALMNIVGILGTNAAYVGVTGADGGISSTQVISNFQFACLTSLSIQTGGAQAVGVAWPNSAGGLELQQAPALGATWSAVTDSVTIDNTGSNQVTLPAQNVTGFYRLATP